MPFPNETLGIDSGEETRDVHLNLQITKQARRIQKDRKANRFLSRILIGSSCLLFLGFLVSAILLIVLGVQHPGWNTSKDFTSWAQNRSCLSLNGTCTRCTDNDRTSLLKCSPRCGCCDVVGGCCDSSWIYPETKHRKHDTPTIQYTKCNNVDWEGKENWKESSDLFLAGNLCWIGVVLFGIIAVLFCLAFAVLASIPDEGIKRPR